MTNEERELMRGLLTEDGMIDFDHPLFEEEEHILDGSEEYVVKSALNNALLDVLLPLLTLEEIVKNIKYLSYKQLEDPLRDLLINDFNKDFSINAIKVLASEVVAEESNSNSSGKLIRWFLTHRQDLHDEFLTILVNKVANVYSDLIVCSDKAMKPTESNFLSFFSKYLYNDMYVEVEEIMNKVILELMDEEQVRPDIENVPDLWLYLNLIKNAESFFKRHVILKY